MTVAPHADVVARIKRAFDAANSRLLANSSPGDREDEVSNMLHHLYRLFELAGGRNAVKARKLSLSPATTALLAVRGADTHAFVRVSESGRGYPKSYPLAYNVEFFELQDGIGIDDAKLHAMYRTHVHGREAGAALADAFDEITRAVAATSVTARSKP